MNHSESIGNLAAAKARAQAQFEAISKDQSAEVHSQRTGKSFSYSYADLAVCLKAVVPALSKEGLALFQPIRFTGTEVEVTTMLVHGDSGEWISENFTCPVVDVMDARSIGSAATYGRRYSLQGLLGIASEDEDDDGQEARGGAHEQAKTPPSNACPACGVVGSIRKNKDGSWSCWRSKGGCEANFPAGGFPTTVEPDLMPRKKEPSAAEQATLPAAGASAAVEREATTPAESTPTSSRRGRTASQARGPIPEPVSAPVVVETIAEPTVGDPDLEEPLSGRITFSIGPTVYETAGITETQMMRTFTLVPQVDRMKQYGKGYSKKLMGELFGVVTRVELTEPQGTQFIAALEQKLAAVTDFMKDK